MVIQTRTTQPTRVNGDWDFSSVPIKVWFNDSEIGAGPQEQTCGPSNDSLNCGFHGPPVFSPAQEELQDGVDVAREGGDHRPPWGPCLRSCIALSCPVLSVPLPREST